MHDLPQSLLAHLQREARDARDRVRASRAETEKQIAFGHSGTCSAYSRDKEPGTSKE